ncbi:MAG TPA: hypothetical protein VF809_01955 [Candidatus Saccharimonadales bacterium]
MKRPASGERLSPDLALEQYAKEVGGTNRQSTRHYIGRVAACALAGVLAYNGVAAAFGGESKPADAGSGDDRANSAVQQSSSATKAVPSATVSSKKTVTCTGFGITPIDGKNKYQKGIVLNFTVGGADQFDPNAKVLVPRLSEGVIVPGSDAAVENMPDGSKVATVPAAEHNPYGVYFDPPDADTDPVRCGGFGLGPTDTWDIVSNSGVPKAYGPN